MKNKGDILITGAYGYIGAHVCKEAYTNGYTVYAIDNKISSNDISPYCEKIEVIDILNLEDYNKDIFKTKFKAVIHCAALILVEESVQKPCIYYETNITGTLNVISNTHFDNFIFASTGGAFDPISPYAKSKVIAENIVKTICEKYNIFRFFNVAGNNGEFGQICKPSHIMHIAAQVAACKREKMIIFGNDYDTKDGTCIRDYVHVQDLAETLVCSIETPMNSEYECVGSGTGYSNIDVINSMKKVTNKEFITEFGSRRAGDPATLKVDTVSEFVEIKRTIEDMCISAYITELKNGV